VVLRLWLCWSLLLWNLESRTHGFVKIFPCFLACYEFCFPFHHKQIMRLFTLLVLLASLAAHAVGQKNEPNPNSSANNGQNTAGAKNPSPQSAVQPNGNQQPSNQQYASSNGEQQSLLPSPQKVSAYSTFFILLTTIAYVIISYLMWRRIGEQVAAAQGSTDALIGIERPWIQVLINRIDIPPAPTPKGTPTSRTFGLA
jgi:hypothetical protein